MSASKTPAGLYEDLYLLLGVHEDAQQLDRRADSSGRTQLEIRQSPSCTVF
jgi:hypothetical protein